MPKAAAEMMESSDADACGFFFFFFSNYDVEKPKAVPVMGEKDSKLIFGILEKFINFKQMDHFIPLYYAANGTICTGM